jgi:hypothetical protein
MTAQMKKSYSQFSKIANLAVVFSNICVTSDPRIYLSRKRKEMCRIGNALVPLGKIHDFLLTTQEKRV